MILPATYLAAVLLLVLSAFCWGSWANFQKLAGKWRFELLYYDYSLGVALCVVVAAFTLGSMNSSELTFQDNFLIASYRKMVYILASGWIFNLGNILLLAAIAVAGMAVAFPAAFGVALVIGGVRDYITGTHFNSLMLFGGALLVVAAILVDFFAYSEYLDDVAAKDPAGPKYDPRTKMKIRPVSPVKGVLLSVLSGILLACFSPVLDFARQGDDGVAPYGMALMFGAGILISTLLYNPFFMNFPVAGEPLQFGSYFKGTRKQHGIGLLAGLVWGAGAIASFLAGAARRVQPEPAVTTALSQGAVLIALLWGVLAWHEFAGATLRVKTLLWGMLVLFVAGVALISLASVYVPS
jgi:glucose uptake protein